MTKISAGSYDLNTWLHGGYDSDIITVIYGDSGTGKTNFCLTSACSQAKKERKVLIIDTEGGYSTERMRQLSKDKEEYEKLIQNIILLKPTNFKEQKEAFEELLKHIKKDNNIGLIIVDGATMLYRIDFAEARKKGEKEITELNAELAKQMRTLSEISRKINIPIIITNQVYRFEDEKRMVGGDILRYWGKCHIELENQSGKRTAYLRKHRSLPEKAMQFQIYDGGIRKKGWI